MASGRVCRLPGSLAACWVTLVVGPLAAFEYESRWVGLAGSLGAWRGDGVVRVWAVQVHVCGEERGQSKCLCAKAELPTYVVCILRCVVFQGEGVVEVSGACRDVIQSQRPGVSDLPCWAALQQ